MSSPAALATGAAAGRSLAAGSKPPPGFKTGVACPQSTPVKEFTVHGRKQYDCGLSCSSATPSLGGAVRFGKDFAYCGTAGDVSGAAAAAAETIFCDGTTALRTARAAATAPLRVTVSVLAPPVRKLVPDVHCAWRVRARGVMRRRLERPWRQDMALPVCRLACARPEHLCLFLLLHRLAGRGEAGVAARRGDGRWRRTGSWSGAEEDDGDRRTGASGSLLRRLAADAARAADDEPAGGAAVNYASARSSTTGGGDDGSRDVAGAAAAAQAALPQPPPPPPPAAAARRRRDRCRLKIIMIIMLQPFRSSSSFPTSKKRCRANNCGRGGMMARNCA